MAAAPAGGLEQLLGGGGNSLRNETSSNAKGSASNAFEGSFGAAWNVTTGASRSAAGGSMDQQTVMVIAAAVLLGALLLRRKG